ncbi:MAG: TIGR03435 family protein, partial [Candidatus Aminicenantes bacterium]|nr:TIGR03435 family protein [Candidatus Aminicenantes bacterium]
AMTLGNLCLALENELLQVVLDETGLQGAYEISLFWNPEEETSIFREIGRQLGLELKQERRPVEVLCFEAPKTESKQSAAVPGEPADHSLTRL